MRQELREATEREAAISEILRAISSSPADVQPVVDAIAEHAARYCAAEDVAIFLLSDDGTLLIERAAHGPVRPQRRPWPPDRTTMTGRAVVEKRTIHVADLQAESAEYPLGSQVAVELGFHTAVATPLLRDGTPFGAIILRRVSIQPFTEQQISLLRTFADQAVIAIENVRLFTETKEALERQRATADILYTISTSPTTDQPVLDAVARNALRFCGAEDVLVFLVDGDALEHRAHAGTMRVVDSEGEVIKRVPLVRETVAGRATLDSRTTHVADIQVSEEFPIGRKLGELLGEHANLAAPLLRQGKAIGALLLRRTDLHPFGADEVALAEGFAAQAVIAIENVRLFNETKEALERQTALAEILRVIARSPTDVQPVLEAIAESAARFCAAEDVSVGLLEGEVWRIRAHHGPIETRRFGENARIGPTFVSGRSMIERRTIHVPDLQAEADQYPDGLAASPTTRAIVATPLLSAAGPIGALFLRRTEATPFTERQIELAETFAAQAVIAIENVRLFNETRDALERQTALGEILRVIAASPSDITPVLDAIAESAARFCVAENVSVILQGEDGLLQVRARVGPLDTKVPPWAVDRTTVSGRAIVEARTIQVPDLQAAGDQYPLGQAQALVLGERTTMAAPLIRDGRGIGVLFLRRGEVRPFSDKQVELVKVFAVQAVIAIENVRLISQIKEKSGQLEVANQELAAASRHKSEFLANMSHELRTPLNAIIGFSDVLGQRLFGELNERQAEYTTDIASSGRHLLDLVNEILDLSKVEAGRMELEPSEFALADTIRGALAFVRERAARHAIALTEDAPADLGTVVADERKVRQVLLNLLSNAVKFTPDGGTIGVRARRRNGEVEVSVRDTGIGIAPEDQAKVFDEFQQVGKPSDRSREGTGLGLTLAKRFIELHGGRIWIESELGKGTTFTFAMPVGRAAAAAANVRDELQPRA
ncbi:MAG: GAF domain-containing protein [Chloroflexota bacterium]|nr:GAF domain-containing protein [Chloroflexota bacterium]